MFQPEGIWISGKKKKGESFIDDTTAPSLFVVKSIIINFKRTKYSKVSKTGDK